MAFFVPRVPPPVHRHSAPSGPWPFLDIDDIVDPARIEDPESHVPMSASPCNHASVPSQQAVFCWCKYPESLFPNWARRQQEKSRISKVIARAAGSCTLNYLDVLEEGAVFVDAGEGVVSPATQDAQWTAVAAGRPPGVRLRAIFVEDATGPVLQMLGTRYNIEPFFFTSSIGWTPSRYQSHVKVRESDHITITLPFVRALQNLQPSPAASIIGERTESICFKQQGDFAIDTQAPLRLRSTGRSLLYDLLSLHLVRTPAGSSIISYHPLSSKHQTTPAATLKTRLHLTGRSVYWRNIFTQHTDPTFVFLSLLWYVLYAWDEALEVLYKHICVLEMDIIQANDIHMTNELHLLRAHLLHYESLLSDFKKSVQFVLHTPNPALFNPDLYSREERAASEGTMKKECAHLIDEIERLERSMSMQDKRLKNVMALGFSMVNIDDSKRMQKLTEAAVRDSAAMKQVAYLTMAFLPSSFVATVFGMNITLLQDDVKGTIGQYVAITIPLTIVTIWIIVAYQIQIKGPAGERRGIVSEPDSEDHVLGHGTSLHDGVERLTKYKYYGPGYENEASGGEVTLGIWTRLWWPAILLSTMLERRRRRREREAKVKRTKAT